MGAASARPSQQRLQPTPLAVRLHGAILHALASSLHQLIERHESLRTTFVLLNGQPVQRVSATGSLLLNQQDLRDLPESRRAATVEQALARL